MGYKLKKIEICASPGCVPGGVLKPNEERELVVELERETRAAIHGVVKFPGGGPVKNALVKLFFKKSQCEFIPITFTFTDECGQFLFGVEAGKEYVIKVFFYTPEEPNSMQKYNKGVCTDYMEQEKKYVRGEEQYTEADLSGINVTNIYGKHERLSDDEALMLKEQDILELDVVVSPPLHK